MSTKETSNNPGMKSSMDVLILVCVFVIILLAAFGK